MAGDGQMGEDGQMKKENVDKMTLQQAMDYSINKLVEQGHRCLIKNECSYGDGAGSHCAVGWLLDEDNEELMNISGGLGLLTNNYGDLLPKLILKNQSAFREFQNFHDFETHQSRSNHLQELEGYGIDVKTNPNWNKWLTMGKNH
jgi:hypothetical protein